MELSETNNLEEGMLAIYDDRAIGVIESIECSKTVKLSTKSYLTRSKNIVFKSESWGIISSIESLDNGGKTTVKVFPPVNIPDNATVEFDDNKTVMNASLRHSGSGTDTVTLTVTVDVEKFGYKDVQYTLDLDKLITRTPNAYDRRVTTAKETAVLIKMFEDDYDSNATDKTGVVVQHPQNGGGIIDEDGMMQDVTYNNSTDSFTYTPAKGFSGEDFFVFQLRDSANTSEERTVYITVK